jgi:hypothetical protein
MNTDHVKKMLNEMLRKAPQTYYAVKQLIEMDKLDDEEFLALFKTCIRDGDMQKAYNEALFDIEVEKTLSEDT